jgi:16S rRNA (uracil1498-N3)-methyltransferase
LPADAAPSFVWAESIPDAGSRITLEQDESRYLTKVCRARAGESVTLTDGRGVRARATLVEAAQAVIVEIAEREQIALQRTATMLIGPPERGRADWLVEKLAELGVAVFQPIDSERAHWMGAEVRLERWRRLARAALRQSLRCHELEVREPVALAAALALTPGTTARYLADPDGTTARDVNPGRQGHTVGLVGPAAGFSTGERESMTSAGYVPISLSDGRLRTETAALALASWWSAAG